MAIDTNKIKTDAEHNGVRYIEYQPGNGTRYGVLFTPLEELGDAAWRNGGGTHMVSLIAPYRSCYLFGNSGYTTVDYVAEKLTNGNLADGLHVAEVMAYVMEGVKTNGEMYEELRGA